MKMTEGSKKKKYRIEFDRQGCIGAGVCAAICPENWSLADDGKAVYKIEELTEEELAKNLEAAQGCPVNVIHIIDLETGKRVI